LYVTDSLSPHMPQLSIYWRTFRYGFAPGIMNSRQLLWPLPLGLLLILLAIVSPAVAAVPLGQWSAESPWPTVGVSLAVLPDGRVATWGEDTPVAGTTAYNTYIVTIPSSSTDTSTVQELTINDDIFCAGFTFLPDGRLFVSGGGDQPAPTNGTGRATTDILDPSSSTWSSGPAMSNRRWYPTATELPSGDILNLLGSIDMNFTPNETPDVTTNGATGIRSLTGVSNATLFYNYPRAFVAPNGKVFLSGMEQTGRYLDTSNAGTYTTVASSIFGFRAYGSAVLYDVGKVLIAGGAPSDAVAIPTNTAEVIDLNAPSPAWRNVGPMAFARRYMNATLMADGKVLITGGSAGSPTEDCTGAILPAEIWDPATELFITVASMPHYRTYHSAAVLLPDGRVLSTGTTAANGPCGGIDYKDADFYSPPYLFNGTRPVISSVPAMLTYGQQFTVGTPNAASISNVNLIALSAATHHFNFNQRISRLSFSKATNSLTVVAPTNSSVAPPGEYMMFILNGAGVPSVARVVQIVTSPTPAVKITAPLNGSNVSGTVSIVTQISSSVSWINLYIDGNYFASSPPNTFSWKSTAVPDGPHTISTRAFSSGGVQLGSDAVVLTVGSGLAMPTPTVTPTPIPSATPTPTPSPTPTGSPSSTPTPTATPTPTPTPTPIPAVMITSPADGTSVSGTVGIITQVTSSVSWINIYIDGNYFASSPPYIFSWNSTSTSNGSHTISTLAFNGNGAQIGSYSLTVSVTN
jgi:hypothetical protein